jgi:hypothetical protein
MALTPIRIPTLQQSVPFVDSSGRLSSEAISRINGAFKVITEAVNGVIEAQNAADAARAAADAAQGTADTAQTSADTAQGRADDAYALAEAKVEKSAGPAWSAPSGALSRASFAAYPGDTADAAYDPDQLQVVMDAVQDVSQTVIGIITDLRANEALTPT